jgi:hypothetical protein
MKVMNETADEQAKMGSLHPFIGPEPIISLIQLQGGSRGTGCAESTRNTGSLAQDKDRQRPSFLSSLIRGLLSSLNSTDPTHNK